MGRQRGPEYSVVSSELFLEVQLLCLYHDLPIMIMLQSLYRDGEVLELVFPVFHVFEGKRTHLRRGQVLLLPEHLWTVLTIFLRNSSIRYNIYDIIIGYNINI